MTKEPTFKEVAPRLWKAHQQRKRELERQRRVATALKTLEEFRGSMERVGKAGVSATQAIERLSVSMERAKRLSNRQILKMVEDLRKAEDLRWKKATER